jgi:hypothetical protein
LLGVHLFQKTVSCSHLFAVATERQFCPEALDIVTPNIQRIDTLWTRNEASSRMFGQFSLAKAAILASLASVSLAQTSTTCNPLSGMCLYSNLFKDPRLIVATASCPADTGSTSATINTDFRNAKGLPAGWGLINAGSVSYDSNGANIILQNQGDSPIIQTDAYFLFGSFEVIVKAATGTGIVSSIVLLSDDLDEVDWVRINFETSF